MENIFENAYFGKPYKTRDGRKAIFSRKDEDTFDLETEDSYNPVRADGSFLYTKKGYESDNDIVSEWKEEINEKKLDEIATLAYKNSFIGEVTDTEIYRRGFKAGYRKAKDE